MTSLIQLDAVETREVNAILGQARVFAERLQSAERHGAELAGKIITTLFLEPSTRTRLSFEQAARFMGADVMTFTPELSSLVKGESLEDTARVLTSIGTDLFVVRSTERDGPDLVAGAAGKPVVNGGAGRAAHPTQALVDCFVMEGHFGSANGLTVGIVGDVVNSRVAASLVRVLPRLGAEVVIVAPERLLPDEVPADVRVSSSLDSELGGLDVAYMLRVQKERSAETGFAGDAEYSAAYGLSPERFGRLPDHAVVMHPGPMNRGVEIASEVADHQRALIQHQVRAGVPTRMAVLDWCLG